MTHLLLLLFIFISLTTAILAIAFVLYAFRVRHGEGIKIIGYWMLASSGWIIAHLSLFLVDNIPQAALFLRMEWLFQVFVPPLYLLFSIQYKGYRRWLLGWRQSLLFIFPVILVFISLLKNSTSLIWQNLSLDQSNIFAPIQYQIGPVQWMFWIFAYICLMVSAWIFLKNNHIRGKAYQNQSILLSFIAIIPLIMSIIFLVSPASGLGFNAAPLSFIVCGIAISFAIFRYRLFDLSPVVYHQLLESLKDGVLVIDEEKRLLQLNHVAAKLIGIDKSVSVGEPIYSIIDQQSPWYALNKMVCNQTIQIDIIQEQNDFYYEVACSSIEHTLKSDHLVFTISDITEEKKSKIAEVLSRETAEIRASELGVLRKVAEQLNRAMELSAVIETGMQEIASGVGARFAYLVLADEERRPKIAGSYQLPPILEDTINRLAYCPPCKSFDQFMNGDYQEPVSFMPCEILKKLSISYPGLISIPLHLGVRQLGVLNLVMAPDAVFTGDEIRLLQTVGDQLSAAIERARLYENAELMATIDSLTGLINRRYFFQLAQKEFERSSRYQFPVTILMIDIDLFKRVNDNFGHLIGDQVLNKIGQHFRTILRSSDVIGRYGGEEFVVLMPETNLENGMAIADRLRILITDHPFTTDKGDISLTISIGVASKENHSEETLETVLENADQALLLAKQNGRNKVEIWHHKGESLP